MDAVKTLIDKWAETRSQRLLAKLLGVPEKRLSEWKLGRRPMPASQFAKLAEMVEGEERARELLWEFVNRRVPLLERISEGFKTLLRRGMALKSKTYKLA